MRIEFRASGGFAGMNIDAVAESESLDAAQSAELEKLVDAAGYFDTKQGWFHSPRSGPGEIAVYKLKLQDEERKNSLAFSDMDMPAGHLALHMGLALNNHRASLHISFHAAERPIGVETFHGDVIAHRSTATENVVIAERLYLMLHSPVL